MKTITIKQPWASLICQGIKDIENRTWPTKYRGRVLVHAGMAKTNEYWPYKEPTRTYLERGRYAGITFSEMKRGVVDSCPLEFGAIIGSVEIVDCVINHPSIWAEKSPFAGEAVELPHGELELIKPTYNWVLANPIRFPEPIPIKGRLGFWDYPNILSEPEEEGGELFCHCQLPVAEKNQVYSMIDHYRCHYCGGKWYK